MMTQRRIKMTGVTVVVTLLFVLVITLLAAAGVVSAAVVETTTEEYNYYYSSNIIAVSVRNNRQNKRHNTRSLQEEEPTESPTKAPTKSPTTTIVTGDEPTATPSMDGTITTTTTASPTITAAPTMTAVPTSQYKINKKDDDSSTTTKSNKSNKSNKAESSSSSGGKKNNKSNKSAKSDDDDDEDFYFSADTGNSTRVPGYGNSTSDDDDDDDTSSTSSSKTSKSNKSEKSNKNNSKSTKAPSSAKSNKSTKSPTTTKSSKSSDDNDNNNNDRPDDSNAFDAQVAWQTKLDDTVATGQLFYDPTSKFGWYTYTADRAVPRPALEASQRQADASAAAVAAMETLARFCAIDIANGGTVMSPCQEIPPTIESASSTEIQSVQACTDPETGAVKSFAVIVHDAVKFLQFTNVLGGRLIVYSVDGGGGKEPVDIPYEGWTSLYADPSISGRPTFSPDCQTVYATWITTNNNPKKVGLGKSSSSTTTVAVDVSPTTISDSRREKWRLDMENNFRRFVGWTVVSPSDGSSSSSTLISATNMPEEIRGTDEATEAMAQMGMVQIDAETGEILQEYFYNDNVFHNAYTNVVLDEDGNTYHVDSAFGMVKFDGSSLDKGPVWQSTTASTEAAAVLIRNRLLLLQQENHHRHRRRHLMPKQIWFEGGDGGDITPSAIYTPAMAYRPALDASNDIVYGSDGTHTELRETVVALETAQGDSVWQTTVAEGRDADGSNVITDDTKFGPASVGSEGFGIYVASGPVVQCYDSKTGSLLWKYDIEETTGRRRRRCVEELDADKVKTDSRTTDLPGTIVSRMEIVDSQSVLVAADGMVFLLQTFQDGVPTVAPGPTTPPTSTSPTIAPSASGPSTGDDDDDDDDDEEPPTEPSPSSAFSTSIRIPSLLAFSMLLVLYVCSITL